MKTCNRCAWYCHADGLCYGNSMLNQYGHEIGILKIEVEGWTCPNWSFDGLEEWERTK